MGRWSHWVLEQGCPAHRYGWRCLSSILISTLPASLIPPLLRRPPGVLARAEMRIDGDNAKNDAVVCHTPMATTQSSSAAVPEVEAYETDVLCLPCSAA